ncbi:MAG: serine--tRNA ligase [Candidatus Woesearchaeota archaeon]|nr:MAG: serine--tRNA ligase [Candidatus Woesearchaeota archaeon]
MLDRKYIREHAQEIKENTKKFFLPESLVDDFLALDESSRKAKLDLDNLRKERNTVSEAINTAKKEGKDAAEFLAKAKELPGQIKAAEEAYVAVEGKARALLLKIPNIIDQETPIGKDDSHNIVKEVIGSPEERSFELKNHVQLTEELGVADFATAATTSGNGFFYLKGQLAELNQALIRFALDKMIEKGYEFVEPPLMIRKNILDGLVNTEEFEQSIYTIEGEDLHLIATSEHPLIGLFTNKTLRKADLPIKLVGYSACFRKEIGSHGIDEKGLFRTHQFYKVEQIIICEPKDSRYFFKEIQANQIELFKELRLPLRIVDICTGDMGVMKSRMSDLEAFAPRQGYVEVGSCSNLTAAQARRLNIRYEGDGKIDFVHTLNNTAIATSRAMVAILEYYQNEDGSVSIPSVLRPYMRNKERIEKK